VCGGGNEGAYEAYAPEPMVLETSRKGRLVGRGATWDCGLWLAWSE